TQLKPKTPHSHKTPDTARNRPAENRPRRHATRLGVIKQDVKVTGSIAKHSEHECHLSTVMHGMVGAVVQQPSDRHRIPASLIEVFNVSQKIRISKRSQELTNIPLNLVPLRHDGF